MELLDLIICACGSRCIPFRTDSFWCHPVVNASLIWAIAILFLAVMLLIFLLIFQCRKNKLKKEMADSEHKYEIDLKLKNYQHEIYWHEEKKKKLTDDQIEKLKKEIETLNNDENVKQLKLKDTEIDLLKKQLDLYKKAIENLNIELRTKESQ